MITLAQRIEALRTERGLSRPALSPGPGLSQNAAEKFETGRQTPHPGAAGEDGRLFQGSPSSISGESNDRTRQETWMDGGFQDEEEPLPRPAAPPGPSPRAAPPARTRARCLTPSSTARRFRI